MKEISAGLVQLAEDMDPVAYTATDNRGNSWACERCPQCHGAMVPPGVDGRLAHLVTAHGWRMDGRQYDNCNQLIAEV